MHHGANFLNKETIS